MLPDCFCSFDGTQVPGGLEVSQVPQMITITFNGAVNVDNIEVYQDVFKASTQLGPFENVFICDEAFMSDLSTWLRKSYHPFPPPLPPLPKTQFISPLVWGTESTRSFPLIPIPRIFIHLPFYSFHLTFFFHISPFSSLFSDTAPPRPNMARADCPPVMLKLSALMNRKNVLLRP